MLSAEVTDPAPPPSRPQLRGKYPNRGFPKIFNDATVGAEAKKLYEAAQKMLGEIIAGKELRLRAVVGLFNAAADGDDIRVYADDSRTRVQATLHTLRQQAQKEQDEAYLALSDFVAPRDSGVDDFVGMFACSAGFGMEELAARHKAAGDDYSYIMAEAIADRLAEALAEVLHQRVRKDLWGYAPDEQLNIDDLLKVKYQGIRPAPGYPSQPDHTEKTAMWELLAASERVGVELTESLAMLPAASVSGLYFGGRCAQYFSVGKIGEDQVIARLCPAPPSSPLFVLSAAILVA